VFNNVLIPPIDYGIMQNLKIFNFFKSPGQSNLNTNTEHVNSLNDILFVINIYRHTGVNAYSMHQRLTNKKLCVVTVQKRIYADIALK